MLLAADTCLDFLVGAGQELGGHHHVLALGKVPEGTAQILLTGPTLVCNGGVKEIDAQLQPTPDDLAGVGLIHRPGMLTVL